MENISKLKLLVVIKYWSSRFICAEETLKSSLKCSLVFLKSLGSIDPGALRNRSVLVEEPAQTFLSLIRSWWRASSHSARSLCFLSGVFVSTRSQMSLSSFGSFSASGATTLLAPDCSSALGLYVPSVCLFFFTTQKSQARTAATMIRTPKMTVGATIAAMLTPCKWKKYRTMMERLDGIYSLW